MLGMIGMSWQQIGFGGGDDGGERRDMAREMDYERRIQSAHKPNHGSDTSKGILNSSSYRILILGRIQILKGVLYKQLRQLGSVL